MVLLIVFVKESPELLSAALDKKAPVSMSRKQQFPYRFFLGKSFLCSRDHFKQRFFLIPRKSREISLTRGKDELRAFAQKKRPLLVEMTSGELRNARRPQLID